ncbi:MAG TPA: RNA pseudouridine synthase [Parvularcula sp.]|nr:RNA pseudouridine synthase [Parvularcula sp.]HBS32665.1 RNA pseudouridine synthase [Parvularcula sp.]HBS36012.1 RNA pseudouridine synthase [Parvularcula sp.]
MSDPDLLARVLYRDGLMLVIDKPAGLPVHARPGTKKGEGAPSLENYFHQLRFGLPRDPALAHRLDRDTTGCLVLGRHPKALRKLHKLFLEGRIEKTYWAICRGVPEKLSGAIDVALKKGTERAGWKMSAAAPGDEGAMTAVTTYRTLKTMDGLSFIEAKPKTGRTHQIRVHLSAIGAPILGDPLYGDLTKEERAGPIMLHARRVVVPISKNREPVTVEAPPPAWMAAMLARFDARA